jgi:hypothetical protein
MPNDRSPNGTFLKGRINEYKGKTSKISTCAVCGISFIRKTLIKNGIRAGKYAYSKVKYCKEHKYLSRWNSERASLAGKKSQENGTYKKTLKKWRDEGGRSWNLGIPVSKEEKKRLSTINLGKTPWNKGKNFVPPTNRLDRARFRNRILKQVLLRDNHTCQMCGSKENLQVDHIQSWSEYVELRFSIDNCRTLCMDCHYKVTYGRARPEGILWGHSLSSSLARKEL